MKLKILVTGSKGMLAHDLIPILKESHEIIAPKEEGFDISLRDRTLEIIKETAPDLVINCAAYTNVDKAEEEQARAFLVNGIGAQNLALACAARGIPLCHISTDYVFNGSGTRPYTPFDNTDPINVYGHSKLAGEKYIQWITNKFYIIRTSWLYGKGGNNFAATVLKLVKGLPELRVVNDQVGSPTYTLNLSHAIKRLIETGAYGIYHFTDKTEGGISWFDFATEIVRLIGFDEEVGVVPVSTGEFPRPARRPAYSVMDTSAYSVVTGESTMDWKDALRSYLMEY